MPQNDILEELFDDKILKILRVFFSEPEKKFYLREVAKQTKVPVASVYRILGRLVSIGVIDQVKVSKFKLYILGDNENTRFLGQVIKKEKQALQVFITRAKGFKNLDEIILQGREEKDRANIIMIGNKIDQSGVKELCFDIKEEFGFGITPLILTREQFEQMSKMGLYSGKIRVLFRNE